MASNKKVHPATGTMPRAGKGKCGPGMGTMPQGVDNTRGGTKLHGSIKDVKRTPNPAPISHATIGGKPARAKGW